MDMDTVIKKLKKDGKSSQLWDANPAMPSEDQNLKPGGGGKGLPRTCHNPTVLCKFPKGTTTRAH